MGEDATFSCVHSRCCTTPVQEEAKHAYGVEATASAQPRAQWHAPSPNRYSGRDSSAETARRTLLGAHSLQIAPANALALYRGLAVVLLATHCIYVTRLSTRISGLRGNQQGRSVLAHVKSNSSFRFVSLIRDSRNHGCAAGCTNAKRFEHDARSTFTRANSGSTHRCMCSASGEGQHDRERA